MGLLNTQFRCESKAGAKNRGKKKNSWQKRPDGPRGVTRCSSNT